jgi:hypothetical protein
MFQHRLCITALFFMTAAFFCSCASKSEKAVSIEKLENIHEKIKNQQFDDIYEEGSISLKNCYSRQEFAANMKEAFEKLKSVDEKLEFQPANDFEKDMNKGYEDWNLPEEYKQRQFYLVRKIASDSESAHEMTIWENNDGKMKLVAYQVIDAENGETKFYGNQNICSTTITAPSVKIDLKQVINNICTKIG